MNQKSNKMPNKYIRFLKQGKTKLDSMEEQVKLLYTYPFWNVSEDAKALPYK